MEFMMESMSIMEWGINLELSEVVMNVIHGRKTLPKQLMMEEAVKVTNQY